MRDVIGVAAPEPAPGRFGFWFNQAVWEGLTNAAYDLDVDLLCFTRGEKGRSLTSGEAYLDKPVDGLVFVAPQSDAPALQLLTSERIPFVTVAGNTDLPYPNVGVDNYGGAQMLLNFLRQLGHDRIAHISGSNARFDSDVRENAYRDFVKQKDLPVGEDYLVRGGFVIEGGRAAAEKLLRMDEPPTAIFAANDQMAFGAIEVALELGLHVPGDLSVVGFDNEPPAALVRPSLTTVRQPAAQIADDALHLLIDLIHGVEREKQVVVPAELVVRDSTRLLTTAKRRAG